MDAGKSPTDAVDQYVDAAKLAHGKSHRRCRAFVRLEVGDEACRLRATRFSSNFRDELRAVDEQHLAAFGGRTKRYGATNTLCRASDDHDLAGKSLRAHAVLGAALGVNFS